MTAARPPDCRVALAGAPGLLRHMPSGEYRVVLRSRRAADVARPRPGGVRHGGDGQGVPGLEARLLRPFWRFRGSDGILHTVMPRPSNSWRGGVGAEAGIRQQRASPPAARHSVAALEKHSPEARRCTRQTIDYFLEGHFVRTATTSFVATAAACSCRPSTASTRTALHHQELPTCPHQRPSLLALPPSDELSSASASEAPRPGSPAVPPLLRATTPPRIRLDFRRIAVSAAVGFLLLTGCADRTTDSHSDFSNPAQQSTPAHSAGSPHDQRPSATSPETQDRDRVDAPAPPPGPTTTAPARPGPAAGQPNPPTPAPETPSSPPSTPSGPTLIVDPFPPSTPGTTTSPPPASPS